jgi:hypothetical protein
MTSELTKEIIVGFLSVFFTALFAGLPSAALFWWTYQRDQERLIVEKMIPRNTLSVRGLNPVYEIIVRNRSLFSVHISAAGFEIDGEVVEANHPLFPAGMIRNTDISQGGIYMSDPSFDPREIASQASLRIRSLKSTDSHLQNRGHVFFNQHGLFQDTNGRRRNSGREGAFTSTNVDRKRSERSGQLFC